MLDHLVTQHGLTLRGNTFVEGLDLDGDRVSGLRCRSRGGGSEVMEARAGRAGRAGWRIVPYIVVRCC